MTNDENLFLLLFLSGIILGERWIRSVHDIFTLIHINFVNNDCLTSKKLRMRLVPNSIAPVFVYEKQIIITHDDY